VLRHALPCGDRATTGRPYDGWIPHLCPVEMLQLFLQAGRSPRPTRVNINRIPAGARDDTIAVPLNRDLRDSYIFRSTAPRRPGDCLPLWGTGQSLHSRKADFLLGARLPSLSRCLRNDTSRNLPGLRKSGRFGGWGKIILLTNTHGWPWRPGGRRPWRG
jgi:hypothetical protein